MHKIMRSNRRNRSHSFEIGERRSFGVVPIPEVDSVYVIETVIKQDVEGIINAINGQRIALKRLKTDAVGACEQTQAGFMQTADCLEPLFRSAVRVFIIHNAEVMRQSALNHDISVLIFLIINHSESRTREGNSVIGNGKTGNLFIVVIPFSVLIRISAVIQTHFTAQIHRAAQKAASRLPRLSKFKYKFLPLGKFLAYENIVFLDIR